MFKKVAIWTNRLLWTVMVSALILVASYISIGRYYIGYVEQYQKEIVEYVADFTELPLTIANISGKWSILSPVLSLRQLILPNPINGKEVLRIDSVSFQLDLFKSLINRTFQLRNLQINGVECSVEEVKPGTWQLQGYASGIGDQSQGTGGFDKIIDIILSVDEVKLSTAQLKLYYFEDDDHATLNLNEISLSHVDDFRRAKVKASFGNTNKPLLAIVESVGDPRDVEEFLAKAYLKLDNIDFESQLPAIKPLGLDLRYAQVDSEIWLDWKPLREISIQGKLKTPMIDLAAISGESVPPVSDFVLHFRAEKDPSNHWDFWLPLLQARWHGENIEFNNILISLDDKNMEVSLPEINLKEKLGILTNLDVLSDRMKDVLVTLNPVGKLENVHLQLSRSGAGEVEENQSPGSSNLFQLRSNLNQVGISAWKGAPAATGVSGYLEVTPDSGVVDLDSESFSMGFPTIYKDPLGFETAQGQVRWSVGKDKVIVKSGPLHLTADHGPATALLALDLPLKKTPFIDPLMTLVIGLKDTDANYRNKFIPEVLNQGFRDWLKGSITSGNVINGGFIYRGSLIPGDIDDKTVQLFFDVENTTLNYHPDWPALEEITGLVMIDDINTTVTATNAKLYGMDVESTRVEVSTIKEGGLWLTVDADVRGGAKAALRVVNESALRTTVGSVFENWELTGKATVALDLGIPLNQPLDQQKRKPEIQVDVELFDANLNIPDYRLGFSSLNGPLNYNSSRGIFSNSIRGELYGKSVNATVRQSEDKNILVDLTGKIDMADVEAWSNQPALTFFSGETKFNAQVAVIPEGGSKFTVDSDLLGIAINLPEPYGKSAEEPIAYTLNLPLNSQTPLLTMSIDKQAELQIAFEHGSVRSGVLRLLNNQKSLPSEYNHDVGFISVTGEMESVVLTQWQPVLEDYLSAQERLSSTRIKEVQKTVDKIQKPTGAEKTELIESVPVADFSESVTYADPGIRIRDLNINTLDLFDQKFGRTVINGEHKTFADESNGFSLAKGLQGWQIAASNSVFEGGLFLPDGSFTKEDDITTASLVSPLVVNLTRLTLPESLGEQVKEPSIESSALDPSSFNTFSANVRIKNVMRGDEVLGNVQFEIRPLSNGIRFGNLQGSIRGITLDDSAANTLLWWSDEQGKHSQLSGNLSIGNLGEVLESWKYERIIESNSGGFFVDLSWPGSPDQWELKTSVGTVDMKLRDGRFLKTSDATEGTLKVVSIINLANVVRRLQFDFKDLFDRGISFDRIDGQIELNAEQLSIVDEISVASPSSSFSLRGSADLQQRLLDMELITTLPAANTYLPWIAALTGGLPAVAGVIVASKIFEKQVDKFSSVVTSIRGDWDNPTLKVERIFDNSSKMKEKLENTEETVPGKNVDPQPGDLAGDFLTVTEQTELNSIEVPADGSVSVDVGRDLNKGEAIKNGN